MARTAAVADRGWSGAGASGVVDTSPELWANGRPSGGLSTHGGAVGSLIRAVGCPGARDGDAPCVADVRSYTARPREDRFGSDGERGGFYGTLGEYAKAVHIAVADWSEEDPATRPHNLILNLSLGWDPQYGGDPLTRIRLAADVAYEATRVAACEGALLIAAAGNQSVNGATGPMYPAAWELVPKACGGLHAGYDPLVHAVGGVDGRDAPLKTARVDGLPRLLAPAAHITVLDEAIGAAFEFPTDVLSGSSLAAAAASGVASLVWSVRPNLAPRKVMRIVYRSGELLGDAADFGYLGTLRPQRRISACRAFQRACQGGAGRCPAPNLAPECPQPRGAGVDASADFSAIVDLVFGALDQSPANPVLEVPAPADDDLVKPWVLPQPGEVDCPLCGIVECNVVGQLVGNPDVEWFNPTVRGDLVVGGNKLVEVAVVLDGLALDGLALDGLALDQPFKVDLCGALGEAFILKAARLELYADKNGTKIASASELFVD